MNDAQWSAVDDFVVEHLVAKNTALDFALETSQEAGLPPIQVSPSQGKLLCLLARLINARSILEIGTLGGYSTIWLASGMATGGRLISLEIEPSYANVARQNLKQAGFGDLVEVRVGPAVDSLALLDSRFDMIFIDADKQSLPDYLEWAIRLSHQGSIIVADNVVRGGQILDEQSSDPDVQGVRRFYELLSTDNRVDATAIQTVGVKGYDGFALLQVLVDPC